MSVESLDSLDNKEITTFSNFVEAISELEEFAGKVVIVGAEGCFACDELEARTVNDDIVFVKLSKDELDEAVDVYDTVDVPVAAQNGVMCEIRKGESGRLVVECDGVTKEL